MSVPKQIEEVIKEKLKNNADIKEIKELMDLYERAKSLFVEEYKMINLQPYDDKQPLICDPYKINYITCGGSGINKELYDSPYGYFNLNCSVLEVNAKELDKSISEKVSKEFDKIKLETKARRI